MAENWLIIGADGQLGVDLMSVVAARGHRVVGYDLPRLDITKHPSVVAVLEKVRPTVVVNAAAFTAVDAAESDAGLALDINGNGATQVAQSLGQVCPGATLVHISTDYVFDGKAHVPYSEDAKPDPHTSYGRSKLAGEIGVRTALPDHSYIVRTAWLYGAHGSNFVKTMLGLSRGTGNVSVVDDQRGQPTWTVDLANKIVDLVEAKAPAGFYHGTNSGDTTWFGFTQEIFRLIGADPERVLPTDSASYPRPAKRPAYSVLGHDKWATIGVEPMRDWREAISAAIGSIRGEV